MSHPGFGPAMLLAAWAIHDIEEALMFPRTCHTLVDKTNIRQLEMSLKQSWIAVGLMGSMVSAACFQGVSSKGTSKLYKGVVAGLEAHVGTHFLASSVLRSYTAGVATAITVMLPGTRIARRELHILGESLKFSDTVRGLGILIPAALLCHVIARKL